MREGLKIAEEILQREGTDDALHLVSQFHHNLAKSHGDRGLARSAVYYGKKAAEARRRLLMKDAAYGYDYANTILNQSAYLTHMDDRQAAVEVVKEGMKIVRDLFESSRPRYREAYVHGALMFGRRLIEADDCATAVEILESSIEEYDLLFERDPKRYCHDFMAHAFFLGRALISSGRTHAACEVVRDVLKKTVPIAVRIRKLVPDIGVLLSIARDAIELQPDLGTLEAFAISVGIDPRRLVDRNKEK